MKYIDLTFDSPAENLACDEALLDLCDIGAIGETLRFWEATSPFVVLGYANRATREASLDACKKHGISVFRRCSGGGTVLQGRGCLNYSLILKIDKNTPSRSISETNCFVMRRHRDAFSKLLNMSVHIEGHTDLAIAGRKFSGNAQRRKHNALIFHGTFLLDFELALIEKILRPPSKQPDYRKSRAHLDFLMNLNISTDAVKLALREAWQTNDVLSDLPLENLPKLVDKYLSDDWNLKF